MICQKYNEAQSHLFTSWYIVTLIKTIQLSEKEIVKHLQEISAMIILSKIAPIKFLCVKFAGINMS